MSTPDPRLDEIQAIPAEAVEAAARAMLDQFYSDKTLKVDDEDRDIVRAILNAAHPVLLAELRKAHEALAAVSAIEEVLDGWDSLVPFRDAEESQRWYSLGKRHAAERIRTEIAEARAAVAAAKGDGEKPFTGFPPTPLRKNKVG